MGTLYQRKDWFCLTCEQNAQRKKRLARKSDREACAIAGHKIEEHVSPIWWIKYSRGGKAYAESSGSTRKGDARDLLRQKEGDISKGIKVSPKIGRIKFEEAAEAIQNDYKINQRRSADNLETRLRLHLKPFFAGMRLGDISADTIRTFTAKRIEAGASAAEINRELAILKRMFRIAMNDGKLLHRPHIPMLREQNVRKGFFEAEQFDALCAKLPEVLRPVAEFAYLTGWRRSEVLSLQWRQVDFGAGEVRLDPGTTKNGEGRTFPMTAALRKLLKGLDEQRAEIKKAGKICPWVFHRDGERIKDFRKTWNNAAKAAGVPARIFHDLRRTAVRNVERAGVPRSAAMAMVGHKTEAIYRRYSIVDSAVLKAAAAKIDATGTDGK